MGSHSVSNMLCLYLTMCAEVDQHTLEHHSTYADSKPRLDQFNVLKSSSGRVVKVKEEMCAHWKDVAIHLRLSYGSMKTIETNINKAEDAFVTVMGQWLGGMEEARKPISWNTLLTVFEELQHGVLAADLREILPNVH